MMRLFLAGLFITSLIAGHGNLKSEREHVVSSSVQSGPDLIITGNGFDPAHVSNWKARNELYKKCGECAFEQQAFPGDLEASH